MLTLFRYLVPISIRFMSFDGISLSAPAGRLPKLSLHSFLLLLFSKAILSIFPWYCSYPSSPILPMFRVTSPKSIQSFWGGMGFKKPNTATLGAFLRTWRRPENTRSHQFTHFVDIQTDPTKAIHLTRALSAEHVGPGASVFPVLTPSLIQSLTPQGSYLLSALLHDIVLLRKVDWTTDFDAFWDDQVYTHRTTYEEAYLGKHFSWYQRWIGTRKTTDASQEEKRILQTYLCQFEDLVKWAFRTEKVYSSLFRAKFKMQREVWDAEEREKILLGCAKAYTDFCEQVPAAYRTKAVKELHWHLTAMRHWVWDCPNAKRIYTRLLA